MAIAVNQEMRKAAQAFFNENAKKDEKQNLYTVNQSAYVKFLKQQGLTEDVQKRFTEVKAAMTAGGIDFIQEKLPEVVAAAKKAGENPKQQKVILKTATPTGKTVITGHAHRRYPQPRNPGEYTEVCGVIELKVTETRLIDDAQIDALAEAVRAVM